MFCYVLLSWKLHIFVFLLMRITDPRRGIFPTWVRHSPSFSFEGYLTCLQLKSFFNTGVGGYVTVNLWAASHLPSSCTAQAIGWGDYGNVAWGALMSCNTATTDRQEQERQACSPRRHHVVTFHSDCLYPSFFVEYIMHCDLFLAVHWSTEIRFPATARCSNLASAASMMRGTKLQHAYEGPSRALFAYIYIWKSSTQIRFFF